MTYRSKMLAVLSVFALLIVGAVVVVASVYSTRETHKVTNAIPDQYVVIFNDSSMSPANVKMVSRSLASKASGEVLFEYSSSVRGLALKATSDGISKIANDSRVRAVYQDGFTSVSESPVATGTDDPEVEAYTTRSIPSPPNTYWGLDMIDQSTLPLDHKYHYTRTGAGVQAYIIDTGILKTHTQFTGRVLDGKSFVGDNHGTNDCNGHGTHVAGIVGGKTYGVAKDVELVPVRVLDCNGSGTLSSVIAGVNWVTNQKRSNQSVPMVANMSLGGPFYMPLDLAVQASMEAGVTYTLAAGNSDEDACSSSPSDTLSAITVGAIGNTSDPDHPANRDRARFSNFGPCLDLFAPGAFIRSAYYLSAKAWAVESGTSMAAPHAAGVAALYLQTNGNANPMQVRNWMVALALKNVVTDPGLGSPNVLLYKGSW